MFAGNQKFYSVIWSNEDARLFLLLAGFEEVSSCFKLLIEFYFLCQYLSIFIASKFFKNFLLFQSDDFLVLPEGLHLDEAKALLDSLTLDNVDDQPKATTSQ